MERGKDELEQLLKLQKIQAAKNGNLGGKITQGPGQGRQTAPTLNKTAAQVIEDQVTNSNYLKMPYVEWRKELAWQCGVFVMGEKYIAKRFYQINYNYVDADSAKEIVIDNLYAILRNKYFKKINDQVDDKIRDIVKNFTMNLASTLKRISFNTNDTCDIVKHIPDYCCAFRNGVYDFKNDTWLFKYDIERLPELSNRIYSYDTSYVIQWYMDFDFEPIGLNIMETEVEEFVEFMKEIEEPYRWAGLNDPDHKNKNMCFELMYNMAFDANDVFSMEKFKHLCEITGYLINVSFLQYFIMLIGSGRNGKNSLFDGCFSNRVVPMPTQNSMFSIENNNFIAGALENKAHNIYLETNEKSVSLGACEHLKLLTGSELQTVERKGKDRYSSWINCKYIWSANEQDKLKFGDISDGFSRRINMYEVFYQFKESIEQTKKKSTDYYFTPFKQDLSDIKDNIDNYKIFIYLAMYGIKNATCGFTKNFKFSSNDWNDSYSAVDLDLRNKVQTITIAKIVKYMESSTLHLDRSRKMVFDTGEAYADKKPKPIYNSDTLMEMGYDNNFDAWRSLLKNQEDSFAYFANNDIYMRLSDIQDLCGDADVSSATYNANFKKMFQNCKMYKCCMNKPYVLVGFENGRLKVRT